MRATVSMALLIVYFYVALYYTAVLPHDLNMSDLNIVKTIQNLFCIPETTCSYQTNMSNTTLSETEAATLFPASINLLVFPPLEPSSTCCEKCSCDFENCEVTDSCCIEALEELWPSKKSKIIMSCDYPELRANDISYANTGVLMLKECPKLSNKNSEIIKKCDQSDNYQDIETKIPVTDNATMFTYKNRFCAFCHNVTDATLHYWDVTLECLNGVLKPRDIHSIVTEVLESESCNLIYSRPTSLAIRQPLYNCRKVISQCNVTGHWKTYNKFIETACLAYSTIYNFKYKNVFCYMCNTMDPIGLNYCFDPLSSIGFADFRALIKLRNNPSISDSKRPDGCPENTIHDPLKKRCRDIECLFPKTLDKENCVYLVKDLGGLTYGIYLKLTPQNEPDGDYLQLLPTVASKIKDEMYVFLKDVISYTSLFSFNLYSKINHDPGDTETPIVIKTNISYFVVYLQVICDAQFLQKSDIVDKMLSFHDKVISVSNIAYNGTQLKYHVELDMYQNDSTIYENETILNPILEESISSKYPLTVLGLPYICPSVRLFSNEFNIVISTESIFIEEFNTTIDINEILMERLPDGKNFSVRLCISTFKQIVQQFNSTIAVFQNATCHTETFSVQTILTFVCTTLSIGFSIVTIVIYLKFKQFNTQPGVNNIILCLLLIFAQSFYQFGSGQSCQVSKSSCQVIGIFVHFSWLFLMFWMNSCCIHMFRVFKLNQTKMAVFNVYKTTLFYVAYGLLCSLILIMINVIVSLIQSDGSDIGYGGQLCYISEGRMVAYMFGLPVAIIVVINIVLFIVVVLQMKNTAKVQNNANRQQFLHIYAKLSTLTGGTWVFGFCSYFFNNAILDYIFIILNASQGVFLFFAFVANWRTLKVLLRRKGSEETNDKNQFSKIGGATGSLTLSKAI